MKKQLAAIGLTLLLVLNCTIPVVFAAEQSVQATVNNTANDETAKQAASAFIPTGSVLLHTIVDNGTRTLKYFNPIKQEKYSVVFNASDNKVLKVKTQSNTAFLVDETKPTVSITQVQKLVKDEIKEVQLVQTELAVVSKTSQYMIQFQSPTLHGRYIIDGKNGNIITREINMGEPYVFSTTAPISWYKLDEITQKEVPSGIITDVDLKSQNTLPVLDVEMYRKGVLHHIIINNRTGAVISKSAAEDIWNNYNYSTSWNFTAYMPFIALPNAIADKVIDASDAIAIAMKKAPQATLVSLKRDYINNIAIFTGVLIDKDNEYEFEIDASTGKMRNWKAY